MCSTEEEIEAYAQREDESVCVSFVAALAPVFSWSFFSVHMLG